MKSAIILAALTAMSMNAQADTWTFYNNVWKNKVIADGTAHSYDASGNAVTEGGLIFCFQSGGVKNTTGGESMVGMWFYGDYDSQKPINYIKVSVPAKTKVTATGSAWGNRGLDFIMNGTTYKMRTDTFTMTNNASTAKELIIGGVYTVKDGVSQVALYKLAVGDELEEDDGPQQLDYSRMNAFLNYGISGAGIPVEGEGRGGWKSGPQDFVRYSGNHPDLPVYKTDDWGETSSGTAVTKGLLPPILPIREVHVRDSRITRGGDGYYYMTGSSGHNIWCYANGIELWRSEDMKDWEYVGLVWDIDKEADAWVKQPRAYGGKYAVRAVWAPEIHYLPKHNNYYICFSMCPGGIGLLKSSTGRPEGPYVNAWHESNKKVASGIDATLFEDEDGTVYFTYGSAYRIYKMNDDLSDFVGEPVTITLLNPDTDKNHHGTACGNRGGTDICNEGAVLFKANGKYYLGGADSYEGRYSTCLAVADNIYGPYDMRHETIPCAGGTGYFQDGDDNWYTTMFGNDNSAHFREKCGIIKVAFSDDGHIYPALDQPAVPESKKAAWEAKWNKVWKDKYPTTSTGIHSVNSVSSVRSESEIIYNLQGQRLSEKPAHGVYVIDGKKYIAK